MAGNPLTATVVGGGIAGLASAVSLAHAGWQITVLERSPAFGEVGAGLAVTGNGMTALAALGLDSAVRAAGFRTEVAGFQDPAGRWLMRIPSYGADPGAVTTILGLHRQRLHSVLHQAAEAADGIELVTAAEVTAVQPGAAGGQPATVTWLNGNSTDTLQADLVVAADGVRSAVRAQLYPGVQPFYSGSTSWRAVIDDDVSAGRQVEVWGPETEFGALRVSDREMYWFGYFRNPEGAVFENELAAARSRFATWAPWIRDLIAATPPYRLMRHDVYYLRKALPAYVSGRVIFVGDAAHAALPTAGQGAASALEDGVCVGRVVGAPVLAGGDMAAALTAYDRARRPRCQRMVRTSTAIARFGADLGGGWRQTVRNTLMRLAPAGPLMKAGSPIVRWTAPN
ncbi:MAG: FAD-dependent oxidoreductase [Nocardiopsaceae bacterium]|nr:FAD-dependent oxidoreductase [Nocardiopsaceae bacterium]